MGLQSCVGPVVQQHIQRRRSSKVNRVAFVGGADTNTIHDADHHGAFSWREHGVLSKSKIGHGRHANPKSDAKRSSSRHTHRRIVDTHEPDQDAPRKAGQRYILEEIQGIIVS